MTKLAANLSMLFTEVDFMDRFAAAAEAGFKGDRYSYIKPGRTLALKLSFQR